MIFSVVGEIEMRTRNKIRIPEKHLGKGSVEPTKEKGSFTHMFAFRTVTLDAAKMMRIPSS